MIICAVETSYCGLPLTGMNFVSFFIFLFFLHASFSTSQNVQLSNSAGVNLAAFVKLHDVTRLTLFLSTCVSRQFDASVCDILLALMLM